MCWHHQNTSLKEGPNQVIKFHREGEQPQPVAVNRRNSPDCWKEPKTGNNVAWPIWRSALPCSHCHHKWAPRQRNLVQLLQTCAPHWANRTLGRELYVCQRANINLSPFELTGKNEAGPAALYELKSVTVASLLDGPCPSCQTSDSPRKLSS